LPGEKNSTSGSSPLFIKSKATNIHPVYTVTPVFYQTLLLRSN